MARQHRPFTNSSTWLHISTRSILTNHVSSPRILDQSYSYSSDNLLSTVCEVKMFEQSHTCTFTLHQSRSPPSRKCRFCETLPKSTNPIERTEMASHGRRGEEVKIARKNTRKTEINNNLATKKSTVQTEVYVEKRDDSDESESIYYLNLPTGCMK